MLSTQEMGMIMMATTSGLNFPEVHKIQEEVVAGETKFEFYIGCKFNLAK